MKKKIYIGLAAILAAAMLTACGQKTEENAGAAGTANTAGTTAEAGNTDPNSPANDGAAEQGSADAGTADDAGNADDQTYDAENQGEEAVGATQEEIGYESSWSGTYSSPEQTVTITAAEDGGSFMFTFKDGIGGNAVCDVNQGIFEGDDGYVITFNLDVDTLTVTVSNDDDAEAAANNPLNGTYSRQ